MDETEFQKPKYKLMTIALAVVATSSIFLGSSIVLAAQINPNFSELARKIGLNVDLLSNNSITTVVPSNADQPVSRAIPANSVITVRMTDQPNAIDSITPFTPTRPITNPNAGMRIRSETNYAPSTIRGVALNGTIITADGQRAVVDWSGCGGRKDSSWAWVRVPSDAVYRDRSAPDNPISTEGWMDRCGLRDGGAE